MPAVLHKRGNCQTARLPSESMRGIPRSHRCARSRPLTLREGGVRASPFVLRVPVARCVDEQVPPFAKRKGG